MKTDYIRDISPLKYERLQEPESFIMMTSVWLDI